MAQTARTTVALPIELLKNVDEVVRSGRVVSRNEFLSVAIRHELERLRREAIDREFEGMADDEMYRSESRRVSGDYEYASWEALRAAESDS